MPGDEPTVDLAVVAYQEDGSWDVAPVATRAAHRLGSLVGVARQQPADGPVIAMVAVEEDYFVVARLRGRSVLLLISDASAALDDRLARDVVEQIGIPITDESLAEPAPAGDLDIVADLGMHEMELEALCHSLIRTGNETSDEDADLYPDEALSAIAHRAGFGAAFDRSARNSWT